MSAKKIKKKDLSKQYDTESPMEIENHEEQSGDESEDSTSDEGESNQDGLISDDIERLERLNFEFEAVPLEQGDVGGIVNLLSQIFLRADIDCESIAKVLVSQSPFGCVYMPAEENADEDNENEVYGVLSMFNLRGTEKFQQELSNFLLQKARKFAEKPVVKRVEELLGQRTEKKEEGLWMIVNEKMLNFPEQISGPSFNSLKEDLAKSPKSFQFEHVIVIVKVRISDVEVEATSSTIVNQNQNKKKGKAEKKRLAASRLAEAQVIYDNPEEALLFQQELFPDLTYFQYPVQSEVEKQSKFHIIVRDGITYRPYRRVCILKKEQFFEFMNKIITSF